MAIVSTTTALEFRVKGQDDVNAALKGISASIGEVTDAAKQQAAAEAALAKTQAEAAAKQKAQVGLLKSLAGAGQQWTGALKSSAQGLGLLSEGLSKSMGILGPWGAAAGAALGVVAALWNKLSKPEDTKPAEDQLARLAEAYQRLGTAASLAAAEMAVASEDAEKRSAAELVRAEQQIRSLTYSVEADERELAKIEEELAGEVLDYDRIRLESIATGIVERIHQTEDEIRSLRGYVATQKTAMQAELDLQAEEADLARFWQEQERLRKEAQAREQADAAARERAADAAAKQAAARAAQETQALAQLRADTERKVYEAQTEDAVERIEYEYRVRREQAERSYADAVRRAEALELIEQQRILAVEAAQKRADDERAKAAEEEQRKRDALTQRAAGLSVAGVAPQTELEKAQAQWDTLRARIIADAAKVEQTMAEYEQMYSAQELSANTEYLRLNQLRIEAANNLATAQEQAYARISAARAADMESAKQATYEQVLASRTLTRSQKDAVNALDEGFSKMAAHADEFGAASTAITAAQMVAAAIKAGADAIEYTAKSTAYFASGNPVAGIGMAAAAAGEAAAAAAYIKGVADLGGSAPSTPAASTAASGGGAQSLTGSSSAEPREMTINFSFEGSDQSIAGALIRGLNATSSTIGHQRLRKQMVQS